MVGLCLTLSLGTVMGCASLTEKANKEKAELEAKKKNYEALLGQIKSKTLPRNLSTAEVRNAYGEPDDVYRAGSGLSSMEVWTYGKGVEFADPNDWHPIRLYFDNDHLIDWNF